MQCSLSRSPVPTLHIGCRPSQHYTKCTDIPDAVSLPMTFTSAELFAAVPQSQKNSSNGRGHMAEKKNNTQYEFEKQLSYDSE